MAKESFGDETGWVRIQGLAESEGRDAVEKLPPTVPQEIAVGSLVAVPLVS